MYDSDDKIIIIACESTNLTDTDIQLKDSNILRRAIAVDDDSHYNILIEDNGVYNSFGSGIVFSGNMYYSVARNNYVHNEDQCIFVSASHIGI